MGEKTYRDNELEWIKDILSPHNMPTKENLAQLTFGDIFAAKALLINIAVALARHSDSMRQVLFEEMENYLPVPEADVSNFDQVQDAVVAMNESYLNMVGEIRERIDKA